MGCTVEQMGGGRRSGRQVSAWKWGRKESDEQGSPSSLAAVTEQSPSCHLEKTEGLQTLRNLVDRPMVLGGQLSLMHLYHGYYMFGRLRLSL